ncbi:glutamate receptor 2.7 [Triticum aestivum]|uniref:glutamate receptor 2.7 n=1 Tax=Triticum aestivum TaxID=4565 RepID=UPI001D01039F|nr:glutamate receptor 2.7-like [Triticum aestivum]
MAVDDFYHKHPNYATLVELRLKDSRGDLVKVAHAAEELMDKNAEVQAIISPQTSSEDAELFAGIAEHSNIPILSSSTATSPASSSSLRSRFFVRTAPNISSQAAPIAAILEAFAWRAAVLLHEDSPYGVGLLSALVHAFQGSRGLTDSVAVPRDATDSRVDAALLALKTMPTKVYIVHMPPALAACLFRRAVVAGMMSEGYVWVTTAGVGNAADSLPNPGDIDYMQGAVSLRPYVPATDQVRSFWRRFKARFRQENPGLEHDDPTVPVTLLWLYDTAWAAAAAAETTFRTAQPTAFIDALLVTKFDGLVGRFGLVDGQLQVSVYEIMNIIGNGARTVGFWVPGLGITTSLYPSGARKELKQILWPGETAAVPIGWNKSPSRGSLRVGVPVRRGFTEFVEISTDPSIATDRVSGYCIDVFNAVMKADAVVGDVTIRSGRMKVVSFTTPFTDTGWSMIIAQKDRNNSMWIFTKPMTPELWLTSLAFFLITGFVVWAIEHKINPRFRGTPWKQLGILFYFAFSTMVFSHKEKLESNLSKFVVIMWVFTVLILTSSYTANLTSVLTIQQLNPTMNEWTDSDYVGVQADPFIEGMVREMGFDEARFRRYTSMDQYADALDKGSDNGGVTAIFAEVPYLRLFLSRYCQGYSMVGPIYKSGGFGFVFPKGSPLVEDVSRAILELAEEDGLTPIDNKWFRHPGACVGRRSRGEDDARLGLWRFRGLFLINAVVSCFMLLIHVTMVVSRERASGSQLRADTEATTGVMLWLRAWLQRFDAFEGPQGEPVHNCQGTVEENPLQGPATGADLQDDAMGDSDSTPVGDTDSGRNAASIPVSEENSRLVGGSSTRPFPHEPAPPALAPM